MALWDKFLKSKAAPPAPPAAPAAPVVDLSQGLLKPSAFYAAVRAGNLLGPKLDQGEVDGCAAITQACKGLPLSWVAYALATAYHETAHSMLPRKEIGGDGYFFRQYDIAGNRPGVAAQLGNNQAGDGVRFAGRGYVQLTGRANYQRAGLKLGIGRRLVDEPHLAMSSGLAAKILRIGMTDGWFTGRGFAKFLPESGKATLSQFTNARAIINGHDRASDIATYAMSFQDALVAGAWS